MGNFVTAFFTWCLVYKCHVKNSLILHLFSGIATCVLSPVYKLIQASQTTASFLGDPMPTLNIPFYKIILNCLVNLFTGIKYIYFVR